MVDIVRALLDEAQKAAHLQASSGKLSYARGVRDMAALVAACANAAENLKAKEEPGSLQYIMLRGYADGLKHIANAADDLIPPGYEP
jgi:hypothetical protein